MNLLPDEKYEPPYELAFHTHTHDDHFAGITTLIRADHRIKYFATPLVRKSVTKKLSALLVGG